MMNGMESIWGGGRCLGLVRSCSYGFSVEETIVYGYVDKPIEWNKITNKLLDGLTWQVGDRGVMHDATLRLKAPFDWENKRVKGVYEDVKEEARNDL